MANQTVWLKVVPPFFVHEGEVLARLAGECVPTLLGHDGGRILLAQIAGNGLYDAELPRLLDMVTLLVGLKRAWAGRAAELPRAGRAGSVRPGARRIDRERDRADRR